MRGLRLFVRPIEAADHPVLAEFLERQNDPGQITPPTPAWGLLGKLLGDVVVVASLVLTDDAVCVERVTVARDLRRKWIGRVMMREVDQLARTLDRKRIVVERAGDAQEFFRRVGFQHEGERWVREI